MIGVYKIETEVVSGTGKFERTGLGTSRNAKENVDTAFNYFKANKKNISGTISLSNNDFLMHVQDLQGIGMALELTLAAFIALCSGALKKPVKSQLAILGSMSIGGTINKVEELASVLQVCFDAGAKKVLIPMASAGDISTVPPELFAKFQISFYQNPEDAVFKALGIE
jgi:ATP-dependent Lon protease